MPLPTALAMRHVAGAGGVDQPGHAEQRVGAELHRVEELVVDPAVDHVDRQHAGRGAQEHPVAAADQVPALDQFDAHLPGQQGVLEVGGVVDAGGQHDHVRIGDAPRRGRRAARPAAGRGYSATGRTRWSANASGSTW